MDIVKRLNDEISYFAGQENYHDQMMESCDSYDEDWKEHKRLFGFYFRARTRAIKELNDELAARGKLPHG